MTLADKTTGTRILLVEDNRDLAAGLAGNLELEGYQVTHCADGAKVLDSVSDFRPDLMILDMMLPHRNGFEILDELRRSKVEIPVLCLTARGEELDKVRALRSGADDYVTKPFGLMELLARVEALLRRSTPTKSTLLRCGDPDNELEIELDRHQVTRNGKIVELAPKEFELLAALARRPNQVLSRQELLATAWGHSGVVVSRTVDTHIAELRRKLERDPQNPVLIVTVRKAGYRLVS